MQYNGLLSTTSSIKLPLRFAHRPPVFFNMASITSSTPMSSHLLYSLPNWIPLTGDADVENGAAATTGGGAVMEEGVVSLPHNGAAISALETTGNVSAVANDETSLTLTADSHTNSTTDGLLAPTYSTPYEAFIAYQSGLLKSNLTISFNHPAIWLAFWYLSKDPDSNEGDGNNAQDDGKLDEDLFLCWIRQDGISCHFRPMHPIRSNSTDNTAVSNADDINSDMAEEVGHRNLRGASSSNKSKKLLSSTNYTLAGPTTSIPIVNSTRVLRRAGGDQGGPYWQCLRHVQQRLSLHGHL